MCLYQTESSPGQAMYSPTSEEFVSRIVRTSGPWHPFASATAMSCPWSEPSYGRGHNADRQEEWDQLRLFGPIDLGRGQCRQPSHQPFCCSHSTEAGPTIA